MTWTRGSASRTAAVMTPLRESRAVTGLRRFTRAETWVHRSLNWIMAVCVFTAACLYFPPLAEIVGRRRLVVTVHEWSGIALPVPLILGLVSRAFRADAGRLGIGYLVASGRSDMPGAAWELEVTSSGRLLAPLLGLDLEAQVLPAAQYEAVLQLFAEAGGDDGPGPDAPPFMVDLSDQGRPGVYARLLGSFELVGIEAPSAERSALLHEALAMLLLHREGVHPRVLAAALWPRGVTEDVRDALVERLRDWLGTDPGGASRLSFDATGRIVLSTSVVSDWDVLQTLHHEATEGRAAGDPTTRRRLLTDALSLARGPLLEDRATGRYGWLAHEIVDAQHPVLVAEIALALSELHLGASKPKAAVAAIETGLAVSPNDERLWLALLRATQATGDPARLEAAANSLIARSNSLNGPSRGLPPRVEALLDELLPEWRGRIAN